MKLRQASALLLCLAPSLILADDLLDDSQRAQLNRRDIGPEQVEAVVAKDALGVPADFAGAAAGPADELGKVPAKIGEAGAVVGAAAVNALPGSWDELKQKGKSIVDKVDRATPDLGEIPAKVGEAGAAVANAGAAAVNKLPGSWEEMKKAAKDVPEKIENAVAGDGKSNKMSQQPKDIPPPESQFDPSSQHKVPTGYGEKIVDNAKPAAKAKAGTANDDEEVGPQNGAASGGRRTQYTPADPAERSKWLVKTMPDTEGKTNLNPPKAKSKSSAGQKSTKGKAPVSDHSGDDHETWHEIFHSFGLSFAMIIFSEIGDKTFLVAALMAMRHARLLVFSAALSALIAMTVLSAMLGHAFPTLLPKRLTTFAAAILFFVFGGKSLHEGLNMPRDAGIGEEMREVEAELEEKELDMRAGGKGGDDSDSDSDSAGNDPYLLESGRRSANSNFAPRINRPGLGRHAINGGLGAHKKKSASSPSTLSGLTNLFSLMLSPAFVQTFIMTFLGEWGDRSQIATIAMAAGQDWVSFGPRFSGAQ
jgi:putative Ca2+/H+ antiporter (TMEM165/GDT1 family)